MITDKVSFRCIMGMLLISAVLPAGCQTPAVSDGFNQIKLGSTLPEKLPAGMEKMAFGASCVESIDPARQSNMSANMRITNALTDDAGNVIAKSYLAMELSHRILFIDGSYKYVVELDVPAEASNNTTKTWKAPPELLLCQSQMMGMVIRNGDEPGVPSQSMDGHSMPPAASFAEMQRRVNIHLISSKAALQAMTEAPNCSPFDLDGVVERFGQGLKASAECRERLEAIPKDKPILYTLSNVPEAILYYRILLSGVMQNEPADEKCPASMLVFIYEQWTIVRTLELLTDRGVFSAVTEDGYDKSVSTLDGMLLHVQNLGGRRVRVEVSGAIIRDPIIAPLLLLN